MISTENMGERGKGREGRGGGRSFCKAFAHLTLSFLSLSLFLFYILFHCSFYDKVVLVLLLL